MAYDCSRLSTAGERRWRWGGSIPPIFRICSKQSSSHLGTISSLIAVDVLLGSVYSASYNKHNCRPYAYTREPELYSYIYIDAQIHVHISIPIYIYIYTYAHTHTHTHTHAHSLRLTSRLSHRPPRSGYSWLPYRLTSGPGPSCGPKSPNSPHTGSQWGA